MLTEKIFVCKTHQVGFGQVLVFRAVVCWRFAEAVVDGCFRGLSVLSVRGALRTPAEQTDGFPNASLDVNFYTTKGKFSENMNLCQRYGYNSSTFKEACVQVTTSLMFLQELHQKMYIFISIILPLENILEDSHIWQVQLQWALTTSFKPVLRTPSDLRDWGQSSHVTFTLLRHTHVSFLMKLQLCLQRVAQIGLIMINGAVTAHRSVTAMHNHGQES